MTEWVVMTMMTEMLVEMVKLMIMIQLLMFSPWLLTMLDCTDPGCNEQEVLETVVEKEEEDLEAGEEDHLDLEQLLHRPCTSSSSLPSLLLPVGCYYPLLEQELREKEV